MASLRGPAAAVTPKLTPPPSCHGPESDPAVALPGQTPLHSERRVFSRCGEGGRGGGAAGAVRRARALACVWGGGGRVLRAHALWGLWELSGTSAFAFFRLVSACTSGFYWI